MDALPAQRHQAAIAQCIHMHQAVIIYLTEDAGVHGSQHHALWPLLERLYILSVYFYLHIHSLGTI